VATLAPGVTPGTNGEPIRKATVQATAAH
jgi:hypothetical protein